MLVRLDEYRGLALHAEDGELGMVDDFRFDEDYWTVRYLVVATDRWLKRRHVLISPISVREPDWAEERLEVTLTRDEVRNSPEVAAIDAMSHDTEVLVARYYGIPAYWTGPHIWGWAPAPAPLAGPPPGEAGAATVEAQARAQDAVSRQRSLRSLYALLGVHLEALDGEIGHVDDAVIDDETWKIKYLLVDTSNWIGGVHVLVPTDLVGSIDWFTRRLTVADTVERIRAAPRYDPDRALDSTLETSLERHYRLNSHAQLAPASRGVVE